VLGVDVSDAYGSCPEVEPGVCPEVVPIITVEAPFADVVGEYRLDPELVMGVPLDEAFIEP
jgi:hypothetical protein